MFEKFVMKRHRKNWDKKEEIEYLKYKYFLAMQNYYLEVPMEILSFKDYKKSKIL